MLIKSCPKLFIKCDIIRKIYTWKNMESKQIGKLIRFLSGEDYGWSWVFAYFWLFWMFYSWNDKDFLESVGYRGENIICSPDYFIYLGSEWNYIPQPSSEGLCLWFSSMAGRQKSRVTSSPRLSGVDMPFPCTWSSVF